MRDDLDEITPETGVVRDPVGGGVMPSSAGISFTVPMPPSVNAMFKNVRGRGRVKTADYQTWQQHALWTIKLQKPARMTGRCLAIIGVERASASADIDNRVKALFDAIVEAGVIEDDRFITGFAISWQPPCDGLARVHLLPVQPIGLTFQPSRDGASGGWFIAPQPDEKECA